jgi:hypothetical protein
MPTLPKPRTSPQRPVKKSSAISQTELEFTPGSLEAELSAIGKSVSAKEWAKLPRDYFANLDHYLYGAPKRK